jgi:hypothetical protein
MNNELLLEEFAITELEQRVEFSFCCGTIGCDDPDGLDCREA